MSARFTIATPCQKRWANLGGDGRRRYCEDCDKQVHAIEQYSAKEWDQIWHESNGHACGMICGTSPPEPRSRRAILLGALLTAVSPLLAQAGRLRMRVLDPTGSVIPSVAAASLLGTDGKPIRTLHANAEGEIAWTDLPMGNCRFTVSAPGFASQRPLVTIRNSDEVRIDVILQVGTVGGVAMNRGWWIFRKNT